VFRKEVSARAKAGVDPEHDYPGEEASQEA